jgi:hypothetical protein
MYGGFELGVAAFLAWCALDPARVRIGLAAATCLFAGVGAGRGISLLMDGGRSIMYTVLATELAATVLAIISLRLLRRP